MSTEIASCPSQSPTIGFFSPEELPMTMQVGMVGTDGIVLAGDTRHSISPIFAQGGARHGYGSSKIRISETGRIAVTCAMDMIGAHRFADAVFAATWSNNDWENREYRLRQIGREITNSLSPDFECLVVFADPTPALYRLQFSSRMAGAVSGDRILTFVHAGDSVNSAIFWSMRYYRRLPVNRLVGLAAHLVTIAGELNTAMVRGLEIVFCSESGFLRLTDEENRVWESKAREWDREIGGLILGSDSGAL